MSCKLPIPFVIPCGLCKYKEDCQKSSNFELDFDQQIDDFIKFLKGDNNG